jgi:hypothetical protein
VVAAAEVVSVAEITEVAAAVADIIQATGIETGIDILLSAIYSHLKILIVSSALPSAFSF